MRKSIQSILLVLPGLLFSGAAFAQETGLPPVEILPHSQLQPGMKGVGKTVFKGTRIEEFKVEVLGVLEKADLNGDLILIRITSGPVVERQAGVIAGMSGSPIMWTASSSAPLPTPGILQSDVMPQQHRNIHITAGPHVPLGVGAKRVGQHHPLLVREELVQHRLCCLKIERRLLSPWPLPHFPFRP